MRGRENASGSIIACTATVRVERAYISESHEKLGFGPLGQVGPALVQYSKSVI